MKKVILIVLLLHCKGWATNAQQSYRLMPENKTGMNNEVLLLKLNPVDSPGNDPDHLQISKNKKTTAWIFLGTGALCTGIGILSFPKTYDILGSSESEEKSATFSSILIVGGIAFLVTSIPYFVSSSIHKHKAGLKMSSQNTGFGVPSKVSRHITGITLTVPIGN